MKITLEFLEDWQLRTLHIFSESNCLSSIHWKTLPQMLMMHYAVLLYSMCRGIYRMTIVFQLRRSHVIERTKTTSMEDVSTLVLE